MISKCNSSAHGSLDGRQPAIACLVCVYSHHVAYVGADLFPGICQLSPMKVQSCQLINSTHCQHRRVHLSSHHTPFTPPSFLVYVVIQCRQQCLALVVCLLVACLVVRPWIRHKVIKVQGLFLILEYRVVSIVRGLL